jgi:pimeloyl-ACP methyl ester carboxylesterase
VSLLDGLVFFPDRAVPDPPPGVEERRFAASDGVRLHAWWAGPPDAPATLLWSHGNGGNIAGRVDVLCALAARGVGVLAYDYRGYGRSEGEPSEEGVHRDVLGAWDHLRARGVAPGRIVAFGESLGAAVSVRLATERPCAGLVLVSPFTRLADVARVHYGPLGVLAGTRFDTVARIGRVRGPLLVAHGDRDEIVPFALGVRLFEAAPEPKRFLRLEGAAHNDVFDHPALLDAIARFAVSAAGGAPPRGG